MPDERKIGIAIVLGFLMTAGAMNMGLLWVMNKVNNHPSSVSQSTLSAQKKDCHHKSEPVQQSPIIQKEKQIFHGSEIIQIKRITPPICISINITEEIHQDLGIDEVLNQMLEESRDMPIPDVIRPFTNDKTDDRHWCIPISEPYPTNLYEIKRLIGYPKVARDAGIMGTVVIRILVGSQGECKKFEVTRSPHPILTKAVVKYIDRLKFTPYISNKKPVSFWVSVPFFFETIN